MKIFIVHRGADFDAVEELKNEINRKVKADLLSLTSNPDNTKWFNEAKEKINQCDLVLFVLGKTSYESPNIDDEIKYAIKKKKQILLYRLNPQDNDRVNSVLYEKDSFTGVDKPLFKEIKLDDLERILRLGYSFDINEKLNDTNEPKRETELIEQYKAYLATSEEVLNRRQNTSNFYTTLNTSILTIAVTIAGVLLGIPALTNNLLIVSIIFFIVSVVGILLNVNWISLLESYGRLNGAKMRVISEIEKNLPANIYDTEWKVMSEKLYGEKYVSFTSIEKRLPVFFIVIFSLLAISSIALFVFALI